MCPTEDYTLGAHSHIVSCPVCMVNVSILSIVTTDNIKTEIEAASQFLVLGAANTRWHTDEETWKCHQLRTVL